MKVGDDLMVRGVEGEAKKKESTIPSSKEDKAESKSSLGALARQNIRNESFNII